MNGHDNRRQQIIDRIKKTALELFTKYEANQVRMDEIAARAAVSKVTIYKYFRNKEILYREVIDRYVDEILAATEKVIDSDLDFAEKIKFTLVAKENSPKVTDGQALFDLLDKYGQTSDGRPAELKKRIQKIMFKFYEQGKKEGYIEESLPFELLYLYSEIFDAGVKSKSVDLKPVLADPQAFDQLMQIYFFGVFRKERMGPPTG
jgi:AcrR family transcriptional regulator